jgi:hypothetical protein
MKQIWTVLLKNNKNKIFLNIMSDSQYSSLANSQARKNIIFQQQLGCDEISISNINIADENGNLYPIANHFDTIQLSDKPFSLNEKGSLEFIVDTGSTGT